MSPQNQRGRENTMPPWWEISFIPEGLFIQFFFPNLNFGTLISQWGNTFLFCLEWESRDNGKNNRVQINRRRQLDQTGGASPARSRAQWLWQAGGHHSGPDLMGGSGHSLSASWLLHGYYHSQCLQRQINTSACFWKECNYARKKCHETGAKNNSSGKKMRTFSPTYSRVEQMKKFKQFNSRFYFFCTVS